MDSNEAVKKCTFIVLAKPKPCFLCNGSFGSEALLFSHLKRKHGILVKIISERKNRKNSQKDAWTISENEDDGYSSFEPDANSTMS